MEFALVAPIFLLFFFALLELGLEMFTQILLDDSVRSAGRQIQIGAVASQAAFVTAVCKEFSAIAGATSCPGALQVYATSGSSFAALTPGTVSAAGVLSPTTFTPGGSRADVLVQVVYQRTHVMPFIQTYIAPGGTRGLLATTVFQNEPY
jgi:Flp pilus assembly protein TadG